MSKGFRNWHDTWNKETLENVRIRASKGQAPAMPGNGRVDSWVPNSVDEASYDWVEEKGPNDFQLAIV